MSTANHLDSREPYLPLMLRIRGTVLSKIWWKVLLVTIYTFIIVYLHNYQKGFHMDFPMSLVTLLGVAMGLLLVFRNNTAYDRYWEGRRLWSQLTLQIRNLTRFIWVGVVERAGNSSDILEKVSAMNLLIAYPYSVKNYLRGEYSYDEENIQKLISHLPRSTNYVSHNQVKVVDQEPIDKITSRNTNNKVKRTAVRTKNDEECKVEMLEKGTKINKNKNIKSQKVAKEYNGWKAYDLVTPTNIPIEITYHLTSYVKSLRIRETCDSCTISSMNSSISSLVDCLTNLERILRTPIPLAYSVHLHQSLWIYILALPYQLVGQLNWFAIPAVAIATFSLLGLLIIGWEIENPFGYDENDLPLSDYCKVIQTEVQRVMGGAMPSPELWLQSKHNYPLAPVSDLDVQELSKIPDKLIRNLLAKKAGASMNNDDESFDETDGGLNSAIASSFNSNGNKHPKQNVFNHNLREKSTNYVYHSQVDAQETSAMLGHDNDTSV